MRVPSTQDWPPLDITFWSSDSDSEELEVVPAVMESEAVRLLAARIPPELFDDILFYVNVDRVSQCDEYNKGSSLRRNRGEPDLKDILTDLKRCSLVCLFWANRCREHMFSDGTLWIRSYEDAKIFRRYVVGGCPRLTPVHQLIGHIHITQNYSGILAPQDSERQTSFLHLLYLPAIQEKFKWLLIDGPVPEGFNSAKLDTPHWGIPPSMVVPGSFLQNEISLGDVHFPSFYHVTKYMRHFTCATSILFRKITWDGRTPTYSLPHISSTIACQRRPRRMGIRAGTGCTNPVNLALTAVMMNPNCPLHRLSDEDRVWIIKFMTLPWGHKADRDVWTAAGFDVSEQTKTMRLEPFSFVFEETPAPTDRSVSALSVVGMHAYIVDHSWRRLPANFDALVTHTRTHPTIRALVLLFDSSDRLQKSIKPFVEVLALATGTIELVLAYEEWKEPRAVGVDLATLEPNGRIWTDLPQSHWISALRGPPEELAHTSFTAQEEDPRECTLTPCVCISTSLHTTVTVANTQQTTGVSVSKSSLAVAKYICIVDCPAADEYYLSKWLYSRCHHELDVTRRVYLTLSHMYCTAPSDFAQDINNHRKDTWTTYLYHVLGTIQI